MMRVLLFLFICFLSSPTAAAHPCAYGPSLTVDRLHPTLQETGFLIEQNGIISPQIYYPSALFFKATKGFSPQFFFDLKPPITLYLGSKTLDRYQRLSAQIFIGEPLKSNWFQARALQQGQALFDGQTDNHAMPQDCLKALRQAERQGKNQKQGLWSSPNLIIAANDLQQLTHQNGHFSLVEGKILSIGNRSRHLYLNFGLNWSQDFTVSLAKKSVSAWQGDLSQLINSTGKTVQVRGILEQRKGPFIRLFDEAQFEIID